MEEEKYICPNCNEELKEYFSSNMDYFIKESARCTCHLGSPPCSFCSDDRLICPKCETIYIFGEKKYFIKK